MASSLTSSSSGPPATTGLLSSGAAAAGATGTGTSSSPQTVTPPLSSYYGTAPTASTYNATNATASTTGAAPTAQASDVSPMAGINSGQINPNDPTNAASQLDAITNANSPYIQLAKQQGLLSAASRGLENSSLGAGASEAAAVQAAAPLAQENASTAASGQLQNSQLNTQANEFNASQENANQQLNAQLQTQTSQFNAGQITAAAAGNATAQNAIKEQTQQIIGQINSLGLQGVNSEALAGIQGKWNSLIASNTSAAQLYGNMMNGISAMLNNTNIAPNKVADAITTEMNMFNSAMQVMDAINGGTAPASIAPTGGGVVQTPTTPKTPVTGSKP